VQLPWQPVQPPEQPEPERMRWQVPHVQQEPQTRWSERQL
jgi:hypothetical protein